MFTTEEMSRAVLEIAEAFDNLASPRNPPPPGLEELFTEVRAGHARTAEMFREIDRRLRQ